MIVTTSLRPTEPIIAKAEKIALDLNLPFVRRNKEPIATLHNQYGCNIFVVSSNRLSISQIETELPLFFHPNSAMFRVKRVLRGETDPFLQATKLTSNMSILDCTLGLASDSIVSSVVVGKNGKVVGTEGNQFLAYLVRHGLKNWDSGLPEMDEAMQRINVIAIENLEYLRNEKTNAFDVVYFDPMFELKIESEGINAIRKMALYSDLDEETIEEAKRVAKHRVVLKDHWQSTRFHRFNFHVYKRTTSQFHYASIEL
ncbi:class I SAM-dependent methyltransferase [Anaerobacillus isosaccharinicus]|uniref:Class I SAM-dependent methyltransferase n=1 Tax=Anaerobacillus isosaccharinicus TaxID=1532552 RepID=A0A1S2MBR8_9BACI|nr:class I SAM-dependent methyltransferase [Anaerobacillus isosaccharinicus]MBA5587250.1 class I SAM-dependent methyltransferase [Anaerobacillus isosaccharinicus]QOY34556.1 class I SAM-dependent methyltransferase [Anaerobacillus isosaccharinicus]